jgi:DNA modification methylase
MTAATYTLHHGDCLDVLRTMPDNSVDSVVTDPPYGLSFMGKKWDYDVPATEVWAECLRVLKPGGHLLAFAGTRTQHRMAVRIEDAGFEIRDMIAWVYGSGFPKSMDVSKAIDRAAGAEREVVGRVVSPFKVDRAEADRNAYGAYVAGIGDDGYRFNEITAPATESARQWQGWGTALKPALEPITMARKPLTGTVAANVLAHGTGALNIDGCRVAADGEQNPSIERRAAAAVSGKAGSCMHSSIRAREGLPSFNKDIELYLAVRPGEALGRWPANLIHDGSAEVVGLFPAESRSSCGGGKAANAKSGYSGGFKPDHDSSDSQYFDTGSAARFFYTAKASAEDRDAGLHGFDVCAPIHGRAENTGNSKSLHVSNSKNPRSNTHPTVKPTDLMRYLVRLVTPPGGVLLDPFNGSGSTGKACMLEGFRYIGIEREADYIAISRARIDHSIALRAAGVDRLHPASARDAHTVDLFGEAA